VLHVNRPDAATNIFHGIGHSNVKCERSSLSVQKEMVKQPDGVCAFAYTQPPETGGACTHENLRVLSQKGAGVPATNEIAVQRNRLYR
jgi:hypothetical protein